MPLSAVRDMSDIRRGFALLAGGGAIGKIVAIAREIVFAAAFGTGSVATGFRVATTASLVPGNLVSGDLISAAFAPNYARDMARDEHAAKRLLSAYTLWITALLGAVAAAVYCMRLHIVRAIIPGLPATYHAVATDFLATLAWMIPLYGVATISAYALSARGTYWANALRPAIQSVGLLGGTAVAVATGEVRWLAWGFVFAWVAYTGACVNALRVAGSYARMSRSDAWTARSLVASGFRVVIPLLWLTIGVQASIICERIFASHGPVGLVAAVDYARTVSESVISVVAVPLGILGLTHLPGLARERARDVVDGMIRFICVAVVPISCAIWTFSREITETLFARGSFDERDAVITADVLRGLSAGLLFQVVAYVLVRVLTSHGENRLVMKWNLVGLAVQVGVQGLLTPMLGGIAIGIGASLNGLIVVVALGIHTRTLRAIRGFASAWLPLIALTILIDALSVGFFPRVGFLVCSFIANISLVPSARRQVARVLRAARAMRPTGRKAPALSGTVG